MQTNQTPQPPEINRQRLDHLKKITFSDVLKIALLEEDYTLAHQMKNRIRKIEII